MGLPGAFLSTPLTVMAMVILAQVQGQPVDRRADQQQRRASRTGAGQGARNEPRRARFGPARACHHGVVNVWAFHPGANGYL
jgi:hypothetical protein